MKHPATTVPAYRVMRVIALFLGVVGLLTLGLFARQMLSPPDTQCGYRSLIVIGGALLLFIGLVGPVRIIRSGVLIPLEIRKTILVQAFVLPLLGLLLLLAGIVNTHAITALASLSSGLLLLASAMLGFYSLSNKLPRNFYIGEMLAIIKSAGISGTKKDSPADREFMRWTQGVRKGVAIGERAPDAQVIDLNGGTAALSSYFGPDVSTLLVLNFGSYSCPHHRKRIDELKALQSRWTDKGVHFLTVYTAEAHPDDGWRLDHQYEHDSEYTRAEDFCFFYAKTLAERADMARWLIEKKQLRMPLVLDSMDDTLLKAYNSWPIRLYIIRDGRVVYCGDQGPFGYEPADADKALSRLFATGQATALQ